MTDNPHAIQLLARRCRYLNLKQSRALFDALYRADCQVLASGNHTKAAERAGIARGSLLRQIRKEHMNNGAAE